MSIRVITLNKEEQELVRLIANGRNNPKELLGVQSHKIMDKRGELETHIMGIGAEVAVARYYGILPCFNFSLNWDKGHSDLEIYGRTCEVKCRTKEGYDFALMSSDPDDFWYDVGILVYQVGSFVYKIYGIISREKFKQVVKVKDYGYGARAIAEPQHFSDPDLIKPGGLIKIPWHISIDITG